MILALVGVGRMTKLARPMVLVVVGEECDWYDLAMEESIEVSTLERLV